MGHKPPNQIEVLLFHETFGDFVEINNSITTDINPAKESFNKNLTELSKELLNNIFKMFV